MSVRQSCQCLIDWRFSRIFLALDAQLVLLSGSQTRTVPLRNKST